MVRELLVEGIQEAPLRETKKEMLHRGYERRGHADWLQGI